MIMNTQSQTAALPGYDRSKLTAGIVHIGLGNFHRAHMAVYLDDLFAMGLAQDWAVSYTHLTLPTSDLV